MIKKKYFVVEDFYTKVEVEINTESDELVTDVIAKAFGYTDAVEMASYNGGILPDIYEISKRQYEKEDAYDVV